MAVGLERQPGRCDSKGNELGFCSYMAFDTSVIETNIYIGYDRAELQPSE